MQQKAYAAWKDMKRRCFNPQLPTFPHYGGRGIKVCERWMNFENFLSDMGDPSPGLSLDRIDNDGDYEPSNCRWVSQRVQLANRSITRRIAYRGAQLTVAELGEATGAPESTVRSWLKRGHAAERAEAYPNELDVRFMSERPLLNNFHGELLTLAEISNRTGIPYGTLKSWRKHRQDIEERASAYPRRVYHKAN